MKQHRVKVVLAAQHALMRVAMDRLLGGAPNIQIVGEASNGQDAILFVERMDPDVLILELEMPTMDGIQTMEQIKQRESQARIIMISLEKDSDIAPELRKRGAWGFFSKQAIPDEIVEAIRQAERGHRQ